MTSATEELRRLLDELRKLACDINEEEIRSHSVITLNQGRYNRQFRLDMNHDWLNAWHAELERILQAIAATLGSGTCHKLPASGEKTCIVRHNSTHLTMEFGYWRCSECGCECFEGARYCMNCGARAVDG